MENDIFKKYSFIFINPNGSIIKVQLHNDIEKPFIKENVIYVKGNKFSSRHHEIFSQLLNFMPNLLDGIEEEIKRKEGENTEVTFKYQPGQLFAHYASYNGRIVLWSPFLDLEDTPNVVLPPEPTNQQALSLKKFSKLFRDLFSSLQCEIVLDEQHMPISFDDNDNTTVFYKMLSYIFCINRSNEDDNFNSQYYKSINKRLEVFFSYFQIDESSITELRQYFSDKAKQANITNGLT